MSNKVTPITIKDPMQEHFQEIAEEMDEYSKQDRQFILWYLMQDFIEEMERDAGKYEFPESVEEYLKHDMAIRLKKSANEIRDILYYSIW